jgi:hypothetical protein
MTGGSVTASLDFIEAPSEWARNVVAVIPGSDPVLKHEYVAIGAHNDHIGMSTPVDHDSLKAFNDARNKMLIANQMIQLTPEQLAAIRVNMDSIRKLHPAARLDSINNGADDDGSGSMGARCSSYGTPAKKPGWSARTSSRTTRRSRWTRSSRRSTST